MEPILEAQKTQSHDTRLLLLVNRYATPLALFLVALGILVCQPKNPVLGISAGLLVFSIVFNVAAVAYLKRHHKPPQALMRTRLTVNFTVNVLLLYFLGAYWQPVWLLLALTPLATAIYGSRTSTLRAAIGVSAALLAVHWLRELHSPVEWAEQWAYAAFIILASLMVNELSALAREGKE